MDIEDMIIKGSLPNDIICSPRDFADSLHVTEHVVRHWMKEGILPVYRIGRRTFINLLTFREMVANKNNTLL
ncbi:MULTISPECIES: MerR family transcriptional regulator [unclassified Endozoicomonas]|uniref:MerR family transcriptional regulator n=1 Tax=unclassified Endozoicomonas TaxID=2644528 RepID=UPI003BB4F412